MTREEQLDWLCRLRSEIYVFMPKEWLKPMDEALTDSIKALEQPTVAENTTIEPFGNSDKLDCISRQEAIENVAQIAKAAAKSDKQKSLCGRIIYMLEHMREVEE